MKKIISIKRTAVTGSFLTVSLILFLNFFSFRDNALTPESGGWQLQTNLQTLLNGKTIADMIFLDSVTGFALNQVGSTSDTGYIFKTTNGGNNWFKCFSNSETYGKLFFKIIFATDSIGYACGGGGHSTMCKTTDRGNTWAKNDYGWATAFLGMSILGKDTIYVTDDNGLMGGVFRSTNGGMNWQRIYDVGHDNPRGIYMINGLTGFYNKSTTHKTTDGGFSWTQIDNVGFRSMKFIDTLKGYKITEVNSYLQMTTNGGANWISQNFPSVPGVATSKYFLNMSFVGNDTIWISGATVWYPNPGRNRALLYKTTNGGLTWGYQLPDTHLIQIPEYKTINFINDKVGWSYWGVGPGIHTTVGGDSTIYVGVRQISSEVPERYSLEQNYPNPFNSISKIKYQISKTANIKIIIYDVTGKEIYTAVNERHTAGIYETTFDGSSLSSGVYFYQLTINNEQSAIKKMVMIK